MVRRLCGRQNDKAEQTHPEFLSRITLTLTVSPAAERKTPLMKFSSIHGSSSPILALLLITCDALHIHRLHLILPQGGLGLILSRTNRRWDSRHVGGRGGSVLESHWTGSRDAVSLRTGKGGVNGHTSLQRTVSKHEEQTHFAAGLAIGKEVKGWERRGRGV